MFEVRCGCSTFKATTCGLSAVCLLAHPVTYVSAHRAARLGIFMPLNSSAVMLSGIWNSEIFIPIISLMVRAHAESVSALLMRCPFFAMTLLSQSVAIQKYIGSPLGL